MIPDILKSRYYWAVLVATALALLLFFWPRHKARYITDEGVVWTTGYHITYLSAVPMTDSIQAIFASVDASASVYNEQSLVSRINRNETDRVDSLFARMYHASWTICGQSGGAYDPTVMPLVNAWGFGYRKGELPTQSQIDSILTFVGMKRTRLADGALHKEDPRTQFDFSSIAKGLAVDEVGRMLERNGVEDYMVEIGGEVLARGKNPHGKPNTGSSQTSNLLSVTVVASDCMTADAWATACMAMGLDGTQSLMEGMDNLGVMTIHADHDGNLVVWSNRRFAAFIL